MKMFRWCLLLVPVVCFSFACSLEPETVFEPEIVPLPADPNDYAPLPTYEAMTIPEDNLMSSEKVTLGKQLFFDKRMSGDGKLSCYSCHVCESGLTDGRPTAVGAFEKQLTRNSPTLWNIGYHAEFYWDGRAKTLEAQAFAAWKGGNMGANPDEVTTQLNTITGYKVQFEKVFEEEATPGNVSKALAAYMRTIISHDTPWDHWQAGDEDAVSEAAKRGYAVFKEANCNNCHDGVLFTDLQYHNVGIGMEAEKPDVGRFKVTQEESDTGAFKTPTLRDISQSGPYFHNGSVATLEEAVDFMLGGGQKNPYLDKENLEEVKLKASEREDLLEFLKSLDQPCNLSEPILPPGDVG